MALNAFFNNHKAVLSPWNGALDQEQIIFNVDLNDFKVLNGYVLIPSTPRHQMAFEYVMRTGSANRPGFSLVLGTVCHRPTMAAVALNGTSKTFALAYARNVDRFTFSEDISFDLVTIVVARWIVYADFAEILSSGYTGLVEMSLDRFLNLYRLDIAKADLNSIITVSINCFYLGDYAWACSNNRYRNQHTFWSEDLSHPDFLTQNGFHSNCHLLFLL